MNRKTMIALRMERQHLTKKANEDEYIELYRDTQPGQNVYWHGFGEPPVISFRADFDDMEFNRQRQIERELVKGRFQGGNLGWLDARDMELFAGMCQKPLANPSITQIKILELIESIGPLNIQQIKEETGMLVKGITPVLHRLQEAFLIYEDQYDGEWDRAWYRFSESFPEVNTSRYTRNEALKVVLMRFCRRMVWFDINMAKSFYKLPVKDIKAAVSQLVDEESLITIEGGFIRTEDAGEVEKEAEELSMGVLVMHRNDILVKTQEHVIKEKYKSEYELLQLLLMDGEIHGAVQGKFKYGPYIIEDIRVDEGYEKYREAIIEAVTNENPGSVIIRFNSRDI